jgi:hypothetical protein
MFFTSKGNFGISVDFVYINILASCDLKKKRPLNIEPHQKFWKQSNCPTLVQKPRCMLPQYA